MSRRIIRMIVTLGVSALFVVVVASILHGTTRNLALPLSDAGIIREQAAEKQLDPALIAAVIYAETKFDPRPSPAGAEGLMQILPSTAYYLAHLSGGVSFTAGDLANPSVNVAYGSYYLRYLLDHYAGNQMLAVAAYNGGLGNVDKWVARAQSAGRQLSVSEIPFPQTRAYVQRVLGAERAYRDTYSRALGISG
jgi:soluble lytic murein transglycosylase